jgi:hypothetical protein
VFSSFHFPLSNCKQLPVLALSNFDKIIESDFVMLINPSANSSRRRVYNSPWWQCAKFY